MTADEMKWLPDPMIDETDPDHFKPYTTLKDVETTEECRPSLKKSVTKKTENLNATAAAENRATT